MSGCSVRRKFFQDKALKQRDNEYITMGLGEGTSFLSKHFKISDPFE
jgi:hypothetical protein